MALAALALVLFGAYDSYPSRFRLRNGRVRYLSCASLHTIRGDGMTFQFTVQEQVAFSSGKIARLRQ